jgi:hypothetical protein
LVGVECSNTRPPAPEADHGKPDRAFPGFLEHDRAQKSRFVPLTLSVGCRWKRSPISLENLSDLSKTYLPAPPSSKTHCSLPRRSPATANPPPIPLTSNTCVIRCLIVDRHSSTPALRHCASSTLGPRSPRILVAQAEGRRCCGPLLLRPRGLRRRPTPSNSVRARFRLQTGSRGPLSRVKFN